MPALEDTQVFNVPPAKKQRRAQEKSTGTNNSRLSSSRIFSPFRTLGLVSPTPVPFTSVPLGKTTFQITTSVGRCLQTYDLRRGLNLMFLSRPQTLGEITATYAWKDRVFAAWGGSNFESPPAVWVFKRGKKIATLETPSDLKEPINQLLVFGSWIIGCCSTSIQVWKSTTYEHYTTLNPASLTGAVGARVLVGKLCTMPTYLNKIFVGKDDGSIDIWNVSTGKLLYTMLPAFPNSGPVTALEPTPALSLLAISYGSGALVIYNILTDEVTLCLWSPSSNSLPITSITFRTDDLGAGDDGRKSGVMATAGIDSGDITLWDLNNGGRVKGVLRAAHEFSVQGQKSGVNKVEFLVGQPVLVSTGLDNAIRTWIFDETPFSPVPRPLHARSGHSAPVSTLGFLPAGSDGSEATGKWLLSASKDHSLWGFSLRKDGQNSELSQGNVKSKAKKLSTARSTNDLVARAEDLKAPEVTCIACSLNRDGGMGASGGGPVWSNVKGASTETSNSTGWESVVTGHKGDKFARTWFWGRKRAGRWALETGDSTEVKSVCVSSCGTFALVGSAGGTVDMFNLQSGMHRQSFPAKLSPAQVRRSKFHLLREAANVPSSTRRFLIGEGKHTKAVTGLVIDNLNRTVISCGLDGKLKFWDFLSGNLEAELDWNPMSAITALRYNSASELVSLSCDDLSIRIVDIETKKLVRELWGCVGQVNDFCFSSDGRWIIAASMDSVIRVWDLPTGHLIDAFRLENTCTSLAFSPTGEFLATAHAHGVGINVWNNRSMFMHIQAKHVDEDAIADIVAPTASGDGGLLAIDAAFEQPQEEGDTVDFGLPTTADRLSYDMLMLSLVPKSRWQTLLHLDAIKQRNKPIEPPKAPEKAPFFLPSTLSKEGDQNNASAQNGKADYIALSGATTAAEKSRISKMQQAPGSSLRESQFTSLLHASGEIGNVEALVEYLKSLSPAKADLEIRSLDPRMRAGCNELVEFVNALTQRLKEKRDYELVNTWMAVFLRVHADMVIGVEEASQEDGSHEVSQAVQKALADWKAEQQQEGKRLAALVGYCRGVVGFLRSAR